MIVDELRAMTNYALREDRSQNIDREAEKRLSQLLNCCKNAAKKGLNHVEVILVDLHAGNRSLIEERLYNSLMQQGILVEPLIDMEHLEHLADCSRYFIIHRLSWVEGGETLPRKKVVKRRAAKKKSRKK